MDQEPMTIAPETPPAKKKVNKGGRPRKQIDWRIVETMFSRGAKVDEVAAYFECSHDTLTRRKKYQTARLRGLARGNWALRDKLYNIAMNDQHRGQMKAVELSCKMRGMHREVVSVEIDPKEAVREVAKILGWSPEDIAPELFTTGE